MGLMVTAIVLLLVIWCYNRYRIRDSVRLAYKVPSNKWSTFFGWGSFLTNKEFIPQVVENKRKYGPNYVDWMAPLPVFVTTDPQTIKEIFTSKNCVNKPPLMYGEITALAGPGLISENEPTWHQRRKLLNKAFTYNVVVSLLPIFHKSLAGAIEEINESLESGKPIEMLTLLRKLTLENASRTVLKRNLGLTSFDPSRLTVSFNIFLEYIFCMTTSYIMKVDLLHKLADLLLYRHVSKAKKEFLGLVYESWDMAEKNDKTDPSYVHGIKGIVDVLRDGVQENIMKMEDVEGEVAQIFTGAFETTSTTLFIVLTLLAMHPEHQQRVYEEVVNVVSDVNSQITLEQLEQLVFLDMVLTETMRLFPPAPQIFRSVTNENVCLSNGLSLPVGQIVCIDLYCLHRCKDLWGPEANSFNPENFLPSNISTRHPYSYMPFSKGARGCIGSKYALIFSKMCLAKMIKLYKISTSFKYEDLMAENEISLKLKKIPQLHFESREQS